MLKVRKKFTPINSQSKEPKLYYVGDYPVIVKPNRLSRSLRLRIDPIRKLPILTVPFHCSSRYIEDFLQRGESWVQQQFAHVDRMAPYPETIFFKGETYQISLRDNLPNKRQVQIDAQEKTIILACTPELVRLRLKTQLKKMALQECERYCEKFAYQLSVSIQKIRIKDYRARWGSCSRDGIITLSWRLIMARPAIFEYVCAHEVAHLVHHDHSKQFWQAVSMLCPNYKELRAELKTMGMSLFHTL